MVNKHKNDSQIPYKSTFITFMRIDHLGFVYHCALCAVYAGGVFCTFRVLHRVRFLRGSRCLCGHYVVKGGPKEGAENIDYIGAFRSFFT